jgi:hypothetical protein
MLASVSTTVAFRRRLGPDSHANGARTYACRGCPDIGGLEGGEGGDFAVIGSDITADAAKLPPPASCGPDERMIRIPRRTLVLARPDHSQQNLGQWLAQPVYVRQK